MSNDLDRKATRWCIEGTWSGYTSSQSRVVHREYTKVYNRANAINKEFGIRYSDGTMLILSVRPMKKGEKSEREINGYGKLISDCIHHGVWSVDELQKVRA